MSNSAIGSELPAAVNWILRHFRRGAIVPTKDVFEALGRGLFEISLIWPAYWIGKIPVAGHINGQLFTWEQCGRNVCLFL